MYSSRVGMTNIVGVAVRVFLSPYEVQLSDLSSEVDKSQPWLVYSKQFDLQLLLII